VILNGTMEWKENLITLLWNWWMASVYWFYEMY